MNKLDARISHTEHMLESILQKLTEKLAQDSPMTQTERKNLSEKKEVMEQRLSEMKGFGRASKMVGPLTEGTQDYLSSSLTLTPPENLNPKVFIQHRVSSVGEGGWEDVEGEGKEEGGGDLDASKDDKKEMKGGEGGE